MKERIYIIGPYCPKDCSLHNAVRIAQHNVDNAIEVGNRLIEQGNYVFVPHLSHYIHTHYSCKTDYGKWWIEEDLTFLDYWATAVYLLKGWTNSDGSLKEFERAKILGLKIMGEKDEKEDM